MQQQQTIGRPARFSGVGLHSGNRVNMTILPAPPNTGIRFRRVDLEGKPEIEARIENVVETARSTTLGKGNVKIHTVEHVLAALAGCGIDNAIIELDANEPPVGDGSARHYCRLIESAGIEVQPEQREPWVVTEPIKLELGDSLMTLLPGNPGLRISCTSADKQGRFTQFLSLDVTPESWLRDIAHARTFCFFEEIEVLIRQGLIKGGSLENAIVIRDDAVLTTEPLRYPDEFVRHKILDIIGDLALLGRPVHGHLIALKPSHTANCALVRLIDAQIRKPLAAAQAFAPPPEDREQTQPRSADTSELAGPPALDPLAVMKILPHRYPFLMIDKVLKIEGEKVVALKNVTFNEPYFQGHFPGHPIMPGVMQLEAIAQAAGILMLKRAENAGKIAYFISAEQVKWRKPVRPGDTLVIEVELIRARAKIGRARGRCLVGGEVVSEAEVAFMLQEG
ncbi:MAG: bifunctional UDP-3-O-[3-hydroxymyristoyl] N-acetylglucosamine deacetylase/3-hydroxyacyl-ACP dehydratase [Verrucomicrobiae bacterium]|nr:bifunctional UDP-3-O-[3-hydroxymyristoyl] N-acetylglucosamine deacetylase/3-hydroxyacyl-ACP dehydratase [Verrucomicrobiae bacterium]MDW7979265.1 bifunctional UDP-3-O-[3-hydroxymyristoyl] N-acetylglucosamine deacetylase/3-hydroxyacyl-ACP dehydratase [Verrucomicrobiales bacterium]